MQRDPDALGAPRPADAPAPDAPPHRGAPDIGAEAGFDPAVDASTAEALRNPPVVGKRFFRIALTVVLVGLLVNVALALLTTDRDLLGALLATKGEPYALVAALSFVPWVMQALRISMWTRFVGHPVPFLGAIRIYAGAVIGSAVTPTAVGAGTMRWALATQQWGLPAGKAASLLTVEAFEDAAFFLVALPLAVAVSASTEVEALAWGLTTVSRQIGDTFLLAGAVLLGLALLFVVAVRGGLGRRLRRRARRLVVRVRRPIRRGAADFRLVYRLIAKRGKSRFFVGFLLASVQWAARYSVATAVIAVLGGAFQPVLFWVLNWVTYAISSVVPTPGATGGAEAAFLLLYGPFLPDDLLGVTTALWRLAIFHVPVVGAVILYPLLGWWRNRARAAA